MGTAWDWYRSGTLLRPQFLTRLFFSLELFIQVACVLLHRFAQHQADVLVPWTQKNLVKNLRTEVTLGYGRL